jgi:CAAX protease family protein
MAIQAAQTDRGADKFTTDYFAWLAVGMLVVGFSEELLFRGVLLVGARSALSEGCAVVFTSALFGVFHFVNLATGQGLGATTAQVGGAGLSGVVFYLARRLSGTIVVGPLLHGASDFFALAQSESGAELTAGSIGDVVAMVIAIVAVVKLVRNDRGVAEA